MILLSLFSIKEEAEFLAVKSSMHDSHALRGLSHPLCGLSHPICMMYRRYVG